MDVMKKSSNFSSKVLKVFALSNRFYCFRGSEHPLSQKSRLPVETEFGDFVGVVQCSGASRPRTWVLIIVGSVAMMSSSRVRGDPVAAGSDGAFENCLGLALDAQIDCGLCCSAAWSAHDIVSQ